MTPRNPHGPAAWVPVSRPPVVLPAPVVAAFDAFLAQRFPRAAGERLLDEVAALSDAFTAERAELPGSYLNQPPRRSAYLAYFHPQQVLRGLSATEETRARSSRRGLWPAGRPRVADLGAGLGAMSQALLLCGTRPAELVLVDHQKSALADARELTLSVAHATADVDPGPTLRLRTANARIEEWLERARREGWRFDLVLMGGVLNEVGADWERLLEGIVAVLDPAAPGGGVAVLVEPALPAVTRRLMALREGALDRTTTIAPCTHGTNCPLLALRKDWCFTVRAAELPPRVTALARRLGHQTAYVRHALWSFAARADAARFEVDPARHARVVSDAMDGARVLCVEGRGERVGTAESAAMLRGDLAVSLR